MKKKILFVEQNTDGTVGGSYFSLLFLVDGLNKSRYSPLVIFYRENELIKRFKKAGCKVMILKKSKGINFIKIFNQNSKNSKPGVFYNALISIASILQKFMNFFICFAFPAVRCYQIIRKENIAIVHLNNTLLRPQEWIFASLFSKVKIIAHERGINNQFSFQQRFLARYLKAIICVSAVVQENLLKHGFPKEKLFLVYNGLDPKSYIPSKVKKELLKEFDIDSAEYLIGIVGNIKQWKGQDIVLHSMLHVKKRFPRVKCFLIGGYSQDEKNYFDYLKNFVKIKGLKENVVFTGHRCDIANLISILKILLHTSVSPEPFGRVLLEGMALRKPVITNNIGAGSEIVVDGKTGLIVREKNPEDLAKAIIYLLENPKKAVDMGKAGRSRLEKNFNINLYISKIQKIYKFLNT